MAPNTLIVIGAGIVGTSIGKGLIKKGYDVVFVDKCPHIIQNLKAKRYRAYLPEGLDGSTSASVSMFCVDTPMAGQNEDNRSGLSLGNIISAVSIHSGWLRKIKDVEKNGKKFYHLIVIRSTVPPGTTRSVILPLIEKYSGLKVGEDVGLCMQPEFLRTASAESDFLHPRATIIGQYNKKSGDSLERIYSRFEGEKIRVNLETAEFAKFIHNCFNATKISFSNEMWLLGQVLGVDANSAFQLALKTAEGYWNPGYGLIGGRPYGGRCLPKDTEGLELFARQNRTKMPLLSAVIQINKEMREMAKEGNVRAMNKTKVGRHDLLKVKK